jgi:hypothetical protein
MEDGRRFLNELTTHQEAHARALRAFGWVDSPLRARVLARLAKRLGEPATLAALLSLEMIAAQVAQDGNKQAVWQVLRMVATEV